jgi:hypothetical protein
MPPHAHAEALEGSVYAELPEPLRDTIVRSFADRVAGAAGAHDNLMFGFRDPSPRSAREALDNLGPMAVNLLVRLYRRIEGIDPTIEAWRHIKWIRNQWWGGSAGIKVVYWDPAAMRRRLDELFAGTGGNRVARDKYIGTLDHQLSPAYALLPRMLLNPRVEAPDADTWREVDEPKKESVHFCVGKGDLPGFERPERHFSLDDIHIDWFSPVEGIDPETSRCNYLEAWEGSVVHWFQAHFGYDAPVFTFQRVEEALEKCSALAAGADRAVEARLRDFASRWEDEKRALAVRGKEGYEASVLRLGEIELLLQSLRG